MAKIVATRPTATREVEIGGVKFTIGQLPREIHLEYQEAVIASTAEFDLTDVDISDLSEEGLAKASNEDKIKLVKLAASMRAGKLRLQTAVERVVAFGVRGHDMTFEDGEAVPFTTCTEMVGGKELARVDDKLLEIYYHSKLLHDIDAEVRKGTGVAQPGN